MTLLSELIVSVPKTGSGEIEQCTQFPSLDPIANTKMAEPGVISCICTGISSRARPDRAAWWLACLSLELDPELAPILQRFFHLFLAV